MKKSLAFLGLIAILSVVAFFETTESLQGFTPSFREEMEEESEEVSGEAEEDYETTLEYSKEGTKIENGYRIETYREYEIYTDEEGNVIKKEPTANYNYLRYKLGEE